ncbi:uncharacterized protein LOC133870867 [Alnus glutinosa]|uniref:uncharacterized protein LOC133870867 n=1 Tax=Alnus glutinosa TaxID=3517 RepID=UPI002D778BF5|nr:uncharacterized protein LOC133870867 [Alnus glutinosa]
MYNEFQQPSTPSLRHKVKLWCFSSSVHHSGPPEGDDQDKPRSPRSPYAWIKSTAQDLPEIRDRCKNLISRIGCRARSRHHRSHSADFSYDPLSYALNFEDDTRVDEFPLNFSARLAASRRDIVAFS